MKWLGTLTLFLATATAIGQQPALHVLAFYSETVEHDHVDFAHQAITFYTAEAKKNHFDFTCTTHWEDLNSDNLKRYQIVVWLNDQPHTPQQRATFETYMEHGGGWLGFHVAAYNDSDTKWPWFVSFLGGAVFYGNNWPPLPAQLHVDDPNSPLTGNLPRTFTSPPNEWYIWKPSPRESKDVKVLMTLAPSSYPIGLKDTIEGGDTPVVWTNTRYRMLYINMGHGDQIFNGATQNRFFSQVIPWLTRPH